MRAIEADGISTELLNYLFHSVRESLGEAKHVEHICPGEAPTKLNGQLFTQCVDYLLAIFGALVLEYVFADALTNFPVKNRKARTSISDRTWVPAKMLSGWWDILPGRILESGTSMRVGRIDCQA